MNRFKMMVVIIISIVICILMSACFSNERIDVNSSSNVFDNADYNILSNQSYTQKNINIDSGFLDGMEPAEISTIAGLEFTGFMKDRLENMMNQWMMCDANPAIIEMIRQRDAKPRRKIVAWYGEFAGKYITSASLIYRMNHDNTLKRVVNTLVEELYEVQDEEGYLGPFPQSERVVGKIHPDFGTLNTWDMWGHYHCILGLTMWYEETGNEKAWNIALKAADYIINYFDETGKNVLEAGETEMNLSIVHAYTILYQKTGEQKYLDFANTLIKAWESPTAGDFLRDGLSGKEFYQLRKPRWESLHSIQALYEMYKITRNVDYRVAFENLWWSILKTDRHNTGGFSSGEKAQGSPYNEGAIETCCTVAWLAMSVDMYKLTGSSYVIDEIELSTLNGVLGYMHPSGRWSTYNSPMLGTKKASAHEIVFQSMAGSPEINCCSVNAPRGLGMIADWATTTDNEKLILNYYGASNISTTTPGGNKIIISQRTLYPADGSIKITLKIKNDEQFPLYLRIPSWSFKTSVNINGIGMDGIIKGEYYSIERLWSDSDEINIILDMSLHFWVGEEQFSGCVSIYRGPILLAYDQRFNSIIATTPPELSVKKLRYKVVKEKSEIRPIIMLKFEDIDKKEVVLCDYASAGINGTLFNSWIPLKGFSPVKFSKNSHVWNVVNKGEN